MKGIPLVSVIVPARDVREWIDEALGSVVTAGLDLGEIECVVVDDGSVDGTGVAAREALERLGLRGVVVEGRGAGPSAARNLGLQLSRAPLVKFLDADDRLGAGGLAAQVAASRALGPSVAVRFSPWGTLDPDGGSWKEGPELRLPAIGRDVPCDLVMTEGFIHLGAALIRRERLEAVGGFDEGRTLIEDVELWLRIARAGGEFRHVPSELPVYFYRQRPGSLSRGENRAFTTAATANALEALRDSRSSGPLSAESCGKYARLLASLARSTAAWDRAKADGLAAEALALMPDYVPSAPWKLRLLSMVIGFRAAVRIAGSLKGGS